MISSVLTITELVKVYLNPVSEGPGKEKNRIRSCSKILLTNLGSLILVIVIMITAFQSDVGSDYSLGNVITYLMFQTVIPSLISMLNPIIYIILTPNFKLKSITSLVGNSTDRTDWWIFVKLLSQSLGWHLDDTKERKRMINSIFKRKTKQRIFCIIDRCITCNLKVIVLIAQ